MLGTAVLREYFSLSHSEMSTNLEIWKRETIRERLEREEKKKREL